MIYIFKKELYTFKARKVVGYRKTPFTWSRVTTTTAPLPPPPEEIRFIVRSNLSHVQITNLIIS